MNSSNSITESSTINEDNFGWFLMDKGEHLDRALTQKSVSKLNPKTPVVSNNEINSSQSEHQSAGTRIEFEIDPSDYSVHDLNDAAFEITARCKCPNAGYEGYTFGQQPLLSLFSQAELQINNTQIEINNNPGAFAPIEYALTKEYDNRANYIQGWQKNVSEYYDVPAIKIATTGDIVIATTDTTKELTTAEEYKYTIFGTGSMKAKEGTATMSFSFEALGKKVKITFTSPDSAFTTEADKFTFDNTSVTKHTDNENATMTPYKITPQSGTPIYGLYVRQRVPLSALFTSANYIGPIFNKKITIILTRSTNNKLICDTGAERGAVELYAFTNFKLSQEFYTMSTKAIEQARRYYQQEIQHVYTNKKTMFVSMPGGKPTADGTIQMNLNLDGSLTSSLLVLAVPRKINFEDQPQTGNAINGTVGKQYQFNKLAANSLVNLGLREVVVSLSNGTILERFSADEDGKINGVDIDGTSNELFDLNANPKQAYLLNDEYQYQRFLEARHKFGQLDNDALSLEDFVNNFYMFCVDLAPFGLTSGANINIKMVSGHYGDGVNPFCDQGMNSKNYSSSVLVAACYHQSVLKIKGDLVEVQQIIREDKNDVEVKL